MEKKQKRDKSASKAQPDVLDPELEKKKKKAIVKGHGIDNVNNNY